MAIESGLVTQVVADDPALPFASAPLWLLTDEIDLNGLSGPPFELSAAFQRAIDSGKPVAAVEIGPTRDLTEPADLARENFPYLGSDGSETYDLFQQGREHLQKGRAAQATVALEKAKKREPDKASIREALGIAYFRIQRYAESESEFRAMLDLSPADDYAHYGLARRLQKLGRKDEARGHMKLAEPPLRPGSEDYAERALRALPRRRLGDADQRGQAGFARLAVLICEPSSNASRRRECSSMAKLIGEIGAGLCVLLGVARGDDEAAAERLAGRIARLRIFENEDGKFDRGLLDTDGAGARRQPVHADRG